MNHPKQQQFFKTTLPVFSTNEQITGLVLFNLVNGEVIKHRGITISLAVSMWNQNACIDTYTLNSIQLMNSGTLSSSYSAAFEFKLDDSLPPTFIGQKYSFKYQIFVTIKKLFGSIQESSIFYVYKPFISQDQIVKQLLTVQSPSIQADFSIANTYLNNETAKLLFHSTFADEDKVESISIILQQVEQYKELRHTKTIFTYQVCDGPPKKDVKYPVFLDFASYHLNQSLEQKYFPFKAGYSISILLLSGSKEIKTIPTPILIVQPELDTP